MPNKPVFVKIVFLLLFFAIGCENKEETTVNQTVKATSRLDFRKVVTEAKDKVFPTVVYIKCIRQNLEAGKKESQQVAGSGVIISPGGEVLTNWHVIDKATEIRCLLLDGRAMDAKLLGKDKDTDLALLQLEKQADEEVPYACLGDSANLKEGDFVMAMGAPLGLNRSVSIGIISCTDRYLDETGQYNLWLQTDASISPGNSGGPLVNTQGQVVGINTLGVLFGGDLGFSVPSDTINFILPQLREHGEVKWTWLGLQLQPLRDFEHNIYFDATEGVIVSSIDPDSPAEEAGIVSRDRILKINGKAITGLTAEKLPLIRRRLGTLEKEKPVEIEIDRKGEIIVLTLVPTEKGKVEGQELDCPRWDFTVKTINRFDNPNLYFHRKEGLFIFGIKYEGNASDAKLQKNDIILKIDGKEAKTLDEIKQIHKQALDNIDNNPKVVLTVLRNGLLRQAVLDFSRDYERQ